MDKYIFKRKSTSYSICYAFKLNLNSIYIIAKYLHINSLRSSEKKNSLQAKCQPQIKAFGNLKMYRNLVLVNEIESGQWGIISKFSNTHTKLNTVKLTIT